MQLVRIGGQVQVPLRAQPVRRLPRGSLARRGERAERDARHAGRVHRRAARLCGRQARPVRRERQEESANEEVREHDHAADQAQVRAGAREEARRDVHSDRLVCQQSEEASERCAYTS